MARRYSRDARGRFAPSGAGATARGGRISKASGKRATVTARIKGGPGRLRTGAAAPKAKGKSVRDIYLGSVNPAKRQIAHRADRRADFQKVMGKMGIERKPSTQRRLPSPAGTMKGTPSLRNRALVTAAGQRKAARRMNADRLKGGVSNIRRTGGLSRSGPASKVVSTKRQGKPAMGLRANAVRTYKPVTGKGSVSAMERWVKRKVDEVKASKPAIAKTKAMVSDIMRKLGRSHAKAWIGRSQKGIKGDMARIETSQYTGKMIKGVRETIQRRAQRAAKVAAKGRTAGRKAAAIYDRQLASTGPGKTRAAKNSIRPGPRGTWKRKPRRKR